MSNRRSIRALYVPFVLSSLSFLPKGHCFPPMLGSFLGIRTLAVSDLRASLLSQLGTASGGLLTGAAGATASVLADVCGTGAVAPSVDGFVLLLSADGFGPALNVGGESQAGRNINATAPDMNKNLKETSSFDTSLFGLLLNRLSESRESP